MAAISILFLHLFNGSPYAIQVRHLTIDFIEETKYNFII